MMRILSSAQAFGYGPASKLVTLVKSIKKNTKDINIDFVGEDIALTYVENNPGGFSKIHKIDNNNLPNLDNYEVIISVMSPEIAVWGFLHKKKVIYIDSLYWFWNWKPENYSLVNDVIKQLHLDVNPTESMKLLKNIEPHHLQFIGHKVSNNSIVQVFSKVAHPINNDIYRKTLSPIEVGPIIDLSRKVHNNKRNKIIISLSGLMSPLNRKEDCLIYATLILNIIDEFVRTLPDDIEVVLTTNPELIEELKQSNARIKFTSLNNSELLSMLNESIVMIAPAGITTVYESLNYDVPIIFLPEQHDGHYKNFLRLGGGKVDERTLRSIFPELLFSTRMKKGVKDIPDEEIIAIQHIIKDKYNQPLDPVIMNMKNSLQKIADIINDGEKRSRLLNKQKNLLLGNIPKFNENEFIEILNK